MSDKLLNKRVIFTLKTGVGIEGILTQWTDERVIITYPNNDNYTIIFNPSDSIMMVSVFADLENHDEEAKYASDLVVAGKQDLGYVEPPEPKLNHFEPDSKLRALKLAELHMEKNNAIKEQLKHHFKGYVARAPQASSYDSPNFTKSGRIT